MSAQRVTLISNNCWPLDNQEMKNNHICLLLKIKNSSNTGPCSCTARMAWISAGAAPLTGTLITIISVLARLYFSPKLKWRAAASLRFVLSQSPNSNCPAHFSRIRICELDSRVERSIPASSKDSWEGLIVACANERKYLDREVWLREMCSVCASVCG